MRTDPPGRAAVTVDTAYPVEFGLRMIADQLQGILDDADNGAVNESAVRKVRREGLFHQRLRTQSLKFPCFALVGEDDVGHVCDRGAESPALGQVVLLGAGHPVAVQGIFCAPEPVELLMGIADDSHSDALPMGNVRDHWVDVLPLVQEHAVEALAQIGLAQLIQLQVAVKGHQHAGVLEIDHAPPDYSRHVQALLEEAFLSTGEERLVAEAREVRSAEFRVGAGHVVVQRGQHVTYQLPVLGIESAGDIGQSQVLRLLVGVLNAVHRMSQTVGGLAHYVAGKLALRGFLHRAVVAEIEDSQGRVRPGKAHQGGSFASACEGSHQDLRCLRLDDR